MILSSIKLVGFRNFKETEINFNKKSLIIGANDVGKTNLLWAIRLLLDRSLSDLDIEPQDSDFYAYEETNMFEIILGFSDVTDDCVVSKMKGQISDDHQLYLAYTAYRDKITRAKSFQLSAGRSLEHLGIIEDRMYRKVLNVKCINSRRDFHSYIIKEKNHLFQLAKSERNEDQTKQDDELYLEIQEDLKKVDSKIPNLNFISSATNSINQELSKLSLHHKKQKVIFDASTSSADNFIKNVAIAAQSNDHKVLIGGDGRLNQIYLALWASKNKLIEENLSEVTIFCIEEPEAHLHPHQQRKLADYLNLSLQGQVLLTSHSPQIASEFSPNSIIRLLNEKGATKAASNGCSQIISDAFVDFGYRLSIIPSEAFFADVVFLVEGPSEEMFYKTLAKQLGIDLDRLNISILMVDGIGFGTFIRILKSLDIQFVLRTDHDIFKIPDKNEHRYAGIQRCISYYDKYFTPDEETDKILYDHIANLKWAGVEPKKINFDSGQTITKHLEKYNFYLSVKDLENDLLNSKIKTDITGFFKGLGEEETILKMQKKKAGNMYSFLKNAKETLTKLNGDAIVEPLLKCKKIIENIQNEGN